MARVLVDEAFVRVSLDSRRAERDARRIGDRVGKAFAKAADAAAGKIQVEFDIDEGDLRRRLKAIDAKVTVGVEFDDDDIRARVRELERLDVEIPARFDVEDAALRTRIRDLESTDVEITALVELADAEARAQLAALADDEVTIPANLDLDDAAFRTQLAALTATTVDIPANLDLDTAAVDAQLAALTATSVQIPADVDVDDTELDTLRARIEALRPTVQADVDIDVVEPILLRGRLIVSRDDIDRQLDQIGALRLNVDEAHIAAQVAAGIKAGEQLAGDVNVNVDTNSTTRILADQTGLRSIRNLRPIRARIDPDVRSLNAALRRLAPTLRVTVDLDSPRIQAVLDALPTLRLAARLDLDGTALGNELRLIEEYFRARPVKIAATLDVDRDSITGASEAISRTLNDTLVNDLGPQGTRRLDIEVDPEVDNTWLARFRAELAAERDLTIPVHVDPEIDDDTYQRALRRAQERAGRAGRPIQSADFLPDEVQDVSVEVEVELDDTALGQARRRIEDTLGTAAADIDVDLDIQDAALRRRLDELTDGIDIPVRFLIFDQRVNERLDRLRDDDIDIPVRLDVDTDEVQARLDAIRAPRLTIDVDVRIDDDALRRANLGGDGGTITVNAILETARFDAELAGLRRTPPFTITGRADLDPSRFDQELAGLRRTPGFRVTAEAFLDTARFDAELAGLRRTPQFVLTARLQLLDGELARIRAQIERMRPVITTRVELDSGSLAVARARIEALRPTITAKVDVDRSALGQLGNLLGGGGGGGGGLGDSGGGGAGSGLTAIASKAGFATLAVAKLVAGLLVGSAVGTALAVAGAAISAAYGAVATSIAALPAVVSLLAVPIAAVALGFEGVKRAAATLRPEFEALQSYTSTLLEGRLTPVFESLRAIFPTIAAGMEDVAGGIGRLAQSLADVLIGASGAGGALEQIFNNVGDALENLRPGLSNILSAFLDVAAQSGAFDAITEAVNRFGGAFRDSVTKLLDNGTLQAAFSGLGDVLGELTEGFVGLVENGIELFAGAAPGVTRFLDELTGFFERFDFAYLGESVGRVFDGLATTLNNVPTSTINAIEDAFNDLGRSFQSPAVQAGFQVFIDAIPGVISVIDAGVQAFSRIGLAFKGLAQILAGTTKQIALSLQAAVDPVGLFSGKYDQAFADALGQVDRGMSNLALAFDTGGPTIASAAANSFSQVGPAGAAALSKEYSTMQKAAEDGGALVGERGVFALQQGYRDMQSATEAGGAAVTFATGTSLAGAPQEVGNVAGQIGAQGPLLESALVSATAGLPGVMKASLGQVNAAILAIVPFWSVSLAAGLASMGTAITAGTVGLSAAMTAALTAVNAVIIAGVQTWSITATTGLAAMALGVTTGFIAVTAAVAASMAATNLTIIAGVQVWALSVQLGFQNIALAATTGFLGVQVAAAAGLALVNTSIIVGVQVWALSVTFGMQAVTLAATAGWALVAVSATTGLTLVNSAIIAGVAVWGLSVTFGMQAVTLAITAGFLGAGAAAVAGLTAVNSAILAGVAVWALSVQLGFATINAAVSTGFINVGAAVAIGMAAGNAAITAGMATWVAAITSSMAVIVSAVQVGVAQMSLAVSVGFSAIAAAAGAGMAAVNSQVIAGMSSLRASVQVGISGAVATMNGAVGQFRAAGSNMGAALAAGLNSQVGAVQAAAARLANAAAAATRAAAAIRSPSRVFTSLGDYMGQGLAVGLEGSEDRIIASARTLVDRVVAETSRLGDGVATASQRAVDASARQISQLSDKGKAAQEILNQINSGGGVFEDFTFKGSSGLVGQLNDSIADAFYAAGNDFELPAMRTFLQDLVKANTTTVAVDSPREDGTAQAVTDLRDAVAALIATLARLNSGDEVVAEEIRTQTAAFLAALRQTSPSSAAERRVLAETGAW